MSDAATLDRRLPPATGDAAAEEAWLRAEIAHDVERGATLYWWSRYRAEDALDEIWYRVLALDMRLIAAGQQAFTINVTQVAADTLYEAIDRHGAAHDEGYRLMTAAARAQIMHGGDRSAAASAAAAVAARRDPLPPDYLISQAVEQAAKEIRMSESWWKKRTHQ